MKQIYESLKKHLEEATDEELQKEFDELSEWNDIGPTVEEYLEFCKNLDNNENNTISIS